MAKITHLAEYIFRRLYQAGVRSVHGVPGDYNMQTLDYVPKVGMDLIDNVNELNAGYAADGYARVNGLGALVTTFGVGELSVINALAGAYAERVPIVHIVGSPASKAHKEGMTLHHTLGDGDYSAFKSMSTRVSCFVLDFMTEPEEKWTGLVDQAVRKCVVQSRPVYVSIPMDFVTKEVNPQALDTPLDLNLPHDDQEGRRVVETILEYIRLANKPVVLVDQGAMRHQVGVEVHNFISISGLPTYVTPMGKGTVDERLPNFFGLYAGDASDPTVKSSIEEADFVLGVGTINSDYNTGGFTNTTVASRMKVDVQLLSTRLDSQVVENVNMKRILGQLSQSIDKQDPKRTLSAEHRRQQPNEVTDLARPITHDWVWHQISDWLREGDIIVTETGTSNFGVWATKFPSQCTAINQVLWGSIGFATGACQGAATAAREQGGRRTVMFIGDGSFQVTAAELSTMLRYDLHPIIFIICNKGYTIERYVHGWDASYNDIAGWKYALLPEAFGAKERAGTYSVSTKKELRDLLNDENFSKPERLQLVELNMRLEDAPRQLQITGKMVKQNAG